MMLHKIAARVETYPVRMGMSAAVDKRTFCSVRAEEPFDTACGIMVFIMLNYVERLCAGSIDGKAFVTYTEENYATGSGILKSLPFGSRVRLEDAVELMIAASDHVAANLMIDALGLDRINETIKRHGFERTTLHKKFLIPKVRNMGTSTPSEYTEFFSRLSKGELISVEASRYMTDILRKQKYKDILTGGLADRSEFTDVASKSGKADGKIFGGNGFLVDGGIIYTTQGTYAVSMFAEIEHDSAISLNEVKSFMQEVSAAVFDAFVSDER